MPRLFRGEATEGILAEAKGVLPSSYVVDLNAIRRRAMLHWMRREILAETLTPILGTSLGGLGPVVSLLSASHGFDLIL
jgi:hypothetical protein